MNFRYENLNEKLFDKVIAFSYSMGSGLGGPGMIAMLTIDGKEYPCGIRLSADDNEFVKASGLYSSCTVGVCCDSSHDAMVKKLCGYILQ